MNHRRKEWVVGQVHTNTIESVSSLLDRFIIGAYRKVSKKHLPAYREEVVIRFNNRDDPYLFRDTLRRLINADTLRYEELVA